MFVLTAGAAEAQCRALDKEIATTPAPPEAPYWARSRAIQVHPTDVVLLGDSHAYYWDSAVWAETFPNVPVVNFGLLGDRTQTTLYRMQDPRLAQISPKFVVLFIGTNNIDENTLPCAVAVGTLAILDRLEQLWPGAAVLVIKPVPSGPYHDVRGSDIASYWASLEDLVATRANVSLINVDAVVECTDSQFFNWYVTPKEVRPDTPCPTVIKDLRHISAPGYRNIGAALRTLMGGL